MDLRDWVAIGSLSVGFAGLALNWLTARGRAQTSAYRDELSKFVTDQNAGSFFSDDARSAAQRAGAYLSLELAEQARGKAAKRAKRAAWFWPRVVTASTVAIGVAALAVYAAMVPREPSANPVSDGITTVYLWVVAGMVLLGAAGYVVDLRRAHRATPNLRKLFGDVASSARLDTIDALSHDRPHARGTGNRMRSVRLRQSGSLKRRKKR